ncbi:MAG: tyrosine-type recombinase/integrase [Eggerthellaceae bacterium]|nr:tyrosine-type recombinase/integrase [Eggerthellaceae bacterium]
MRREDLHSGLADEIWAFREFKKACGIEGGDRDWMLRSMDRYLAETGSTEICRESVEGFIRRRIDTTRPETYNWICYVRDFTRWAALEGIGEYVVPAGSYKTGNARKTPYLLTEAEVDSFFGAMPSACRRGVWSWQAKAFFGLMHACGLRTGEAAALAVEDVDFGESRLTIASSKGSRTRVLPVTPEVNGMLSKCHAATSGAFGEARAGFFVNNLGKPVTVKMAGWMFGRIWAAAGLPDEKSGARPRAYCFRHRFAYANIERWAREGRDVDAMLPYLAKYMGHAHIGSTYYYVHTSPDFMSGFADMVRSTDSVMPEVGFDG